MIRNCAREERDYLRTAMRIRGGGGEERESCKKRRIFHKYASARKVTRRRRKGRQFVAEEAKKAYRRTKCSRDSIGPHEAKRSHTTKKEEGIDSHVGRTTWVQQGTMNASPWGDRIAMGKTGGWKR